MTAAPRPDRDELVIGDVRLPQKVLIAPMTGVSDLPFRQTTAAAGAVYCATEMVAGADFAKGRPDVVRRAAVGTGLPLTVIQLLGRDPEDVARGAVLAERAGADIIDLNMGCPAKEVVGARCGAALMQDLDLAERLIASVVRSVRRPVTVKMRLGWADGELTAPELARRAEAAGAAAVTVHGRTRAAFYGGVSDPARVAEVKRAVRIPVIVNGDVVDLASARRALAASGADGVMLGRAVQGRPWLAAALEAGLAGRPAQEPEAEERLEIVAAHLRRALAFYGCERHAVRVFRKHLAAYVEAGPGPADAATRRAARAALCRLEAPGEIVASLARLWRDGEGGGAELARAS